MKQKVKQFQIFVWEGGRTEVTVGWKMSALMIPVQQ